VELPSNENNDFYFSDVLLNMEDIQKDQWCQNISQNNSTLENNKLSIVFKQKQSTNESQYIETDPENLNIVKFVAKYAKKMEKSDSNRAKTTFKQNPLVINTQPIKPLDRSDSVIKNVIKKPPINKNNL